MRLEWQTQTPSSWFEKVTNVALKRPCRLARIVHEEAVKGTPARTGQLRASWNLSPNFADYTTVDVGGAPGSPLPPPVTPQCSRFANTYVVANGKYYAGYVEDGSPTTFPTKMLAKAIQKASNSRI